MKYFSNNNNPEELKKQFRAYCVTMQPGIFLRVGQVEDFKPCRLADIDDEDVKKYVARFERRRCQANNIFNTL